MSLTVFAKAIKAGIVDFRPLCAPVGRERCRHFIWHVPYIIEQNSIGRYACLEWGKAQACLIMTFPVYPMFCRFFKTCTYVLLSHHAQYVQFCAPDPWLY